MSNAIDTSQLLTNGNAVSNNDAASVANNTTTNAADSLNQVLNENSVDSANKDYALGQELSAGQDAEASSGSNIVEIINEFINKLTDFLVGLLGGEIGGGTAGDTAGNATPPADASAADTQNAAEVLSNAVSDSASTTAAQPSSEDAQITPAATTQADASSTTTAPVETTVTPNTVDGTDGIDNINLAENTSNVVNTKGDDDVVTIGEPINGDNPTDSTNPDNPTDSTNPDNPTDSTNPDNPTDSTNPDNPTDSTNPDNPTDSTNPDNPTDSTNPDNPTDSTNPDNPTDSTDTDTSVDDGGLPPVDGGTPPDETPVAANEDARITGDPHFKGGDGGKYDIQGDPGKSYNMLSDKNLQLNGKIAEVRGEGSGLTVLDQTGLVLQGDDGNKSVVTFDKDGNAAVDGTALQVGQDVDLADGGKASLSEDGILSVTTGEGYLIRQTTKENEDYGYKYVNAYVDTGENGVDHGQLPGGLLGQTFDADSAAKNGQTGYGAQGEGAIAGVYTDYEVTDLNSLNGEGPAQAAAV